MFYLFSPLLRISTGLILCINLAYATFPPTFSDCLFGDGEEYDQVEACQQLLRSNSKKRDLHVALGKTLDKRQKYKQAVKVYKEALLIFPGDDYFVKKHSIAKSNLEEQEWLLKKNRNSKSGTTKITSSSASVDFKLNKLRCTRLTGDTALKACNKAIKLNNKDNSLFISKGDIYASQQKNRQAVTSYKRALKLNPEDKITSNKLKKLIQRTKPVKKVQVVKQTKTNQPKKVSPKPKIVPSSSPKVLPKPEPVLAKAKAVPSPQPVVAKAKAVPPPQPVVAKAKAVPSPQPVVAKAKAVPSPQPVVAKAKVVPPPQPVVAKAKVVPKTQTESAQPQIAFSSDNNTVSKLKPAQQKFLEQLNFLKSLKIQGIINQAEYERRKKALLDANFRVVQTSTETKPKAVNKKFDQALKNIDFGNYHALIIGNNNYKHLPKLETAVHDAQSLASLLKNDYGFKVKLLLNSSRYATLKVMGELRNTLTRKDNLLIYYAGHGILDNASERGYWLPVDAEEDFTSNWISTAEITDTLKALQSWHVLVVADSCYSGTLARSAPVKFKNPDKSYALYQRLFDKKSRTVITSGGLEPVTDSGGNNHSVFAQAFIDVLQSNDSIIEAEQVFSRLRDKVILNADQTPEYSNVRKVGHNGGDFIFKRQ